MSPPKVWSVKGITPEARRLAKEAAKREGVFLGQWLNQRIAEAAQAVAEASLTGETTAPKPPIQPLPAPPALLERDGEAPIGDSADCDSAAAPSAGLAAPAGDSTLLADAIREMTALTRTIAEREHETTRRVHVTGLEADVGAINQRMGALVDRLTIWTDELTALRQRADEGETRVDALDDRVADIDAELAKLRAALEAARAETALVARAAAKLTEDLSGAAPADLWRDGEANAPALETELGALEARGAALDAAASQTEAAISNLLAQVSGQGGSTLAAPAAPASAAPAFDAPAAKSSSEGARETSRLSKAARMEALDRIFPQVPDEEPNSTATALNFRMTPLAPGHAAVGWSRADVADANAALGFEEELDPEGEGPFRDVAAGDVATGAFDGGFAAAAGADAPFGHAAAFPLSDAASTASGEGVPAGDAHAAPAYASPTFSTPGASALAATGPENRFAENRLAENRFAEDPSGEDRSGEDRLLGASASEAPETDAPTLSEAERNAVFGDAPPATPLQMEDEPPKADAAASTPARPGPPPSWLEVDGVGLWEGETPPAPQEAETDFSVEPVNAIELRDRLRRQLFPEDLVSATRSIRKRIEAVRQTIPNLVRPIEEELPPEPPRTAPAGQPRVVEWDAANGRARLPERAAPDAQAPLAALIRASLDDAAAEDAGDWRPTRRFRRWLTADGDGEGVQVAEDAPRENASSSGVPPRPMAESVGLADTTRLSAPVEGDAADARRPRGRRVAAAAFQRPKPESDAAADVTASNLDSRATDASDASPLDVRPLDAGVLETRAADRVDAPADDEVAPARDRVGIKDAGATLSVMMIAVGLGSAAYVLSSVWL